MVVKTFLALDTSTQSITVKEQIIPHPDSGLMSFAAQNIHKGEIVGYYHGSLDYANLAS